MSNKVVTIRDIARLSGVAPSTVSRVLNNRYEDIAVTAKTKARIMGAANEFGYLPNVHAQRLFAKKSFVLGMVIPTFDRLAGKNGSVYSHVDTLLNETINGVVEAAGARGYHTLMILADEKFISQKDYLNLFRNRSVDGMLVWGICMDERYIEELEIQKKSFVLLNTYHKDKKYNKVYVDNYVGSSQLCRHLLELGHKNIGYIMGSKKSTIGLDRYDGFVDVLKEAGVFREDLVAWGDYSFESGQQACKQIIEHDPDVTAIGCGNDNMALGAIEVLIEKGFRVPEDISVTGADASFPFGSPRLTSIRPPLFEVGKAAAEALIDQLESKSKKEDKNELIDVCFEPKLVIGNSTCRIRSDNSIV